MQGLWKSKLSGWNSKGQRRKSQSFNQYIKDKGLYYSRKEPSSVVSYSGDIVFTCNTPGYRFWAPSTTLKMFVHENLLESWKRWTLYNDGKRRKIAQRTAHHADRVRVRTWLSKRDWDSEIKTHALSKSIAWEVY